MIEDGIIRSAKQRAGEDGRSLIDLIQDALVGYIQKKKAAMPEEGKAAYHLFCERPMTLPPKRARYVLQEDLWNL